MLTGVAIAVLVAVSCGDDDDPAEAASSLAVGIIEAVDAVEQARGGPQEFFEVTATPQLVNVFVAVDDASAFEPYVYLAGELQPPAPKQSGVSGQTFTRAEIDFDPATILAGVTSELPTATIDALSVEGGPGDTVRFVVSARSAQGGVLDIVVTRTGAVVEVIPLT